MVKKLLMVFVPLALLLQTLFLVWALLTVFQFDERAWNVFLNAKLPLIWTQITVPLILIYCLDWMTSGHTISAILDVECDSSDLRVLTAALFLSAIFWGSVWAVKGGF